jgi:enoyl-CoA hydratase/carnithine racemase
VGDFINVEQQAEIALVVFNRPEVLNAWHRAMRREIVVACHAIEHDPHVRAVVFTGAGERAFGAGQDLGESGPAESEIDDWVEEWRAFFGSLRDLSKPTVAALNGVAAGSAFQFALLCDFRIGHRGCRMGQPEIKSGVGSAIGPWIIHTFLGPACAADLTLTGRLMDAGECRDLGLLNQIVGIEEVLSEAMSLAGELAGRPGLATQLTKERLRSLTEPGFAETFDVWKHFLRRTIAAREASGPTA